MEGEKRPKVTWKVNSRQIEGGRFEPYAVVQIDGPEGMDFEPIWGAEDESYPTKEEADAKAEELAKEWLRKYYRKLAMSPKGPGL